ncbi:unconventional myosin-XVIIIa-like isoform X2 [Littorina saxatilis]|uniref:unconventional myosin-XVIIIa-like isoform X2 n=1 Tax=Littorina saxatilis TaxID=31220 RepID=UPI0038B608AA
MANNNNNNHSEVVEQQAWETSSHHSQHGFTPGTSMESLSSIPEGRITPSCHFHSKQRTTSTTLTRHHSTTLGRGDSPGNDARPWHSSLRRQNSAPQLEPPAKNKHLHRQRLGSSESVSSRSRHGSSESVNSDSPGNRTSRCSACSSLAHEEVDPFSPWKAKPAVKVRRKIGVRRNYNSHGGDGVQSGSSFSAADLQGQGRHPAMDKSNNSFGEADRRAARRRGGDSMDDSDHRAGRRGEDSFDDNDHRVAEEGGDDFDEADEEVVMRRGRRSGERQSNSFGEEDSAHSHTGRRRSDRHSGGDYEIPGSHTTRRVSERASAHHESQGHGTHDTPAKKSDRLSSGHNHSPADQSQRKRVERPSGVHNERPSSMHSERPSSVHNEHSSGLPPQPLARKKSERPSSVHSPAHSPTPVRRKSDRPSSVHNERPSSVHNERPSSTHSPAQSPTPARRKSERLSSSHSPAQSPTPVRRRSEKHPPPHHHNDIPGQNTARRRSERLGLERQNSSGLSDSHEHNGDGGSAAHPPHTKLTRTSSGRQAKPTVVRKISRKSSSGPSDAKSRVRSIEQKRLDGTRSPVPVRGRSGYFDLDKALEESRRKGADGSETKSEDQVETERLWLEAERVWLVHKGGFTSARLQPGGATDGTVNIKLDSGEVLTVDEEDIEKANPNTQDRVEDLTALRYLNESSALHVLRQRYAGNLPHTYAGPSLLIINPMQPLPLYSEKIIQMFRGCKQEDLPPHIFSAAQIALRDLLNTRRDQSLVFMGRSGSGKTTAAYHTLHYLLSAAGSVNNIFTVDKLNAVSVLLKAFGNSKTLLNTNASRYTQITTLDFDPSGVIASASVQVLMFEKSRVIRRPEGEPTFNVLYYLLAGVDAHLRNELHLQNLTEPNQFMTPLQKDYDRQKATNEFGRVLQAFQMVGASDEEMKTVLGVLAAVYHLGVAGATKGTHNKFQFTRPAAAQRAASLLGTTPEELQRSIFTQGGSSTLTRSSSLRVPAGLDKSGLQTADANTSVTEALEAFVVGLYTDAFNAVVSLINRSLSSNVRTMSSLVVVDSPGFQNPATCGRQTGANFEDLCNNYLHERMQLLYHETSLTAPQDRYAQENIDCEFDQVTSSPAALVNLMDQANQQGLMRSSNTDLRNADKKGLLWILDEESMFPGASEDSFMERFFAQHGEQQVRKDSLLRKGSLGYTFILNHNQGTVPVQYNAAGWLKICRDNPISKNSTIVLQDSKSPAISQLFCSIKGAVGGIVSGSIAGMEGSNTLRRVGSMRRTFMSGTVALKKKSVCIQVKFQADSLMEILRKTNPHFVFCFMPQQTAGLCELREKIGPEDIQVNVPLLRSQLRGFEILDALRLHRQGFPEYMQFREFTQKFQAMVPPNNRPSPNSDEKQAVNQVLDNLDVDKLNYRVGLSKVFFRPGVLSQLEAGRDEKLTGIVTHFQALVRGYLGRKKTEKLRVQHLAVRCIQRNVKKYMLIREWPWWKLYTKVKPILNVHRTEEELIDAQAELETMKNKVEKLEKERNEYKTACEKLESRLAEMTADLMEENTTSTQASEMLEAESTERMRLEKEMKDIQSKYATLKRQNEKLHMEVMQTRVWQAQSLEEELEDEVDGGSSVYKERCERLMRELQLTKKQMQQQHEEDLEQELQSRKMVEKRLHEAVEEAEEQRRQVQVAKKKTQRLTAEMQDIKLHLEEQMARNNELERKQRRFDSELASAHEDVREEKHLREKLQRERDQLLSEKYSLEQSVQNLRMDHQSSVEKAERLEKELNDILVSGKDKSEVVSLKRVKHELELKLREQEEELDDMAGQIQQLEQTKLRLEMNMEKLKKQHSQELEEKEEELEDMRTRTQKKLRSMESQLEEEYEEKRRVMEEKANLERQLQEFGNRAPSRDKETEKRLKKNLKKTKALLADAGTMLAKQKNTEAAKQQIALLRNQLDDAEFTANAAVKAKKRMELEIQDLNQQLEDLSRSKQEVETKNMALLREKTDLQSQLDDNEEELSEVMKKFKAAVQQQSVHQITLTDQLQQIEELIRERDQLRQQVADLTAKVQGYEEGMVDKHSVTRLETKLRDYESRLELEQSQRQRSETHLSRLKEHVEKVSTEKEDMVTTRVMAEEVSKRAQKQLRELREELADSQKKEMEAAQKFKEREHELESLETELAQCRADLKLAFRRIADLQAALEEELDSDADSLNLEDSDLDSDEDDLDSYLGNHHGARGMRLSSSGGPHYDKIRIGATNGTDE